MIIIIIGYAESATVKSNKSQLHVTENGEMCAFKNCLAEMGSS